MHTKFSIALLATSMLTLPSVASAKELSAEDVAAMRAEIAALRAQVETLESRLDSAVAVPPLAVSSAPSPQPAEAKQSTTVPAPLQWAADTKISGRVYYNMSSVSAKDASGANVQKEGGFQIKRVYVGIDHKFNDVLSGNVTTDISPISGIGQTLYIKKAYLQAKFNPALIIRLGAADMPWVPYSEGLNGYRHIEKVITDLDGFGTSSDWGVHVMGSAADGVLSYQLSAIDGGGYRNPQLSKAIDFEGRLSLTYKGFNAAVGGYTGKLGKDVQGATVFHTANRLNALLAYQGQVQDIPFTIGGEYFYAKNWKQILAPLEDASSGYSLFASVVPLAQWSLFGRYDWVKPSRMLNPLQKDNYYQFGIQYSPAHIVDLALVYKRDNADDGLKIGNLGAGQATRNELGLYGQFRF